MFRPAQLAPIGAHMRVHVEIVALDQGGAAFLLKINKHKPIDNPTRLLNRMVLLHSHQPRLPRHDIEIRIPARLDIKHSLHFPGSGIKKIHNHAFEIRKHDAPIG
jgi:hypothetical protein